MEKIKKIVTHPGNAHRDDLYSVCIALAKFGIVPVCRREPTYDELQNPEILVLDVGGRYDPELMNFDHHQIPRDAEPDCALSLFLGELGIEIWFELQPWYKFLVTSDSKGPLVAAREIGLEKLPPALYSPIEGDLLEVFASEVVWSVNDPFLNELREIGARLLLGARKFHEDYQTARALINTIQINGLNGFVQKDRVQPLAVRLLREREHGNEIAFSIAKSDREGEGWVLYRYDDHPRIDFTRLDRYEKLLYIHKNGFLAKTFPTVSLEETIELMKSAIVSDGEL